MSISDSQLPPVGRISSFNGHDLGCDGMYVGGDGNVYSAVTPPDQVPAFEPTSGATSGARIVLVNGILTTAEGEAQMCKSLADATGAEVVGLHNATSGSALVDTLQAVGDKSAVALHALGVPYRNEATETLRTVIQGAIDREEPVNVFGHSQGGLIISSALNEVAEGLRARGDSEDRVHAQLSLVHVQTFGAAAWTYPQGVDYFHHVNDADPVPDYTGLGTPDLAHILGDAFIGQNVPEAIRSEIGEILQALSGHPHNVVDDAGARYHEFDHPEPWLDADGQLDVQAHSFQLYMDELRQDPGALGAIFGPGLGGDEGPAQSGHLLHGHAEIDDFAPLPGSHTTNYESRGADVPDTGESSHATDGWWWPDPADASTRDEGGGWEGVAEHHDREWTTPDGGSADGWDFDDDRDDR